MHGHLGTPRQDRAFAKFIQSLSCPVAESWVEDRDIISFQSVVQTRKSGSE